MFEYLCLVLYHLYLRRKVLKTKQMQRGSGDGGGGGAEDWFTEGQSPNYDSARFTKPCNINEIQRFAKIPETARD